MSNMQFKVSREEILNELETTNDDNVRAAGLHLHDQNAVVALSGNVSSAKQQQSTAVTDEVNLYDLWTPSHIAFLDQHIWLSKGQTPEATFDFINQTLLTLSNDFQNFRVYPEEMKTIGYHLDETREGCYRLQLFSFKGKLGVNCTRMAGDSLALCSLWNALKRELHDSEFYVDKFIVEGEEMDEEDDEIFGEDGDEDEDSFKYLDFSRDPAFVSKMIDDIQDINVGTHALLLLKFNMQKERNLLLISESFAQNLFDSSVQRLAEQNTTVPDAICLSHILTHLFEQTVTTLTVTLDQVGHILDAAEKWSAEDMNSKTIVPTSSEEASALLLATLSQAFKQVGEGAKDELNLEDRLSMISSKSQFEQVKTAMNSMEQN